MSKASKNFKNKGVRLYGKSNDVLKDYVENEAEKNYLVEKHQKQE